MIHVHALLVLLVAGCSTRADVAQADKSSEPVWESRVALDVGVKLGGCAVGDLNVPLPGEDIVAVAGDGKVWTIGWDGKEFRQHVVDTLPGEMIQCALGKLNPARNGDEIVVVGSLRGSEDDGGRGVAWSFDPSGSGSRRVKLVEADALLHAVCIGDLDPARAGNECLVAGYAPEVYLIWREGEVYRSRVVARIEGPAKAAAAGVGRAVLGCADGRLIEIAAPSADAGAGAEVAWTQRELARFDTPLARVALDGDAVLVCANDGRLRYVAADLTTHELLRADDRLRGAVAADLLPARPGNEWATAGYDGTIRLLAGSLDAPTNTVVGRDDNRLHHLAGGTLTGLGPVLVGCGYSGRVTVVAQVR